MDWGAILTESVRGLQYFLLFFWFYWLFISVFGFGKPKKQKEHEPQKRFLLMVAAHNEEAVIGQLVDNLNNLDYPKDLYEVCVIADNCDDKTAEIARNLGATVIEHTYAPGEPKGKPYAIKYAVDDYGVKLQTNFDGISFFDADNLVSLNFLKEMNNHLMNGDKLVQCYLDSKNPDDNWVSLSYAASYYYMNRSWQLAKYRLGLGNAIGGTGFCVDTTLFHEVGWTARSLTEDLEFTMQCLLRGVPAKWCHFARVYDEKPQSFVASCVQRLRWARGHWDVCFRYTPRLLWRTITKFDVLSFDGALYLINPGKIILNALTAIIIWISIFTDSNWSQAMFPWQLWVTMLVFQFTYIGYTILVDSKKKLNVLSSFIAMAIFNLSYIPLFVWSLVTFKNKSWNPTKHTRAIEMDEMQKNDGLKSKK
ncbi:MULTISPECIES: glycosyltransferase family 2 protein [Bacillus cereus group]|uniref:Glycosyl transferase family 2 n=1 Tax=Bacillus thuringiensis TaxID=1428 RepID=A0A9X6ZQM0_BACTU|nr:MULTISPECIES: glycosyltransferase family 2 protein [Bacillus cereus group]MDA1674661.1 glycosyltransferase family 2 protein [Bacillus cereus group sp. TH152-1LC]PFJ31817.1 glycosyl transferase family 2 [Bacillus thuringiensis]PGP12597.1 glycosyl transferase family 2 [Bacillus cereus]